MFKSLTKAQKIGTATVAALVVVCGAEAIAAPTGPTTRGVGPFADSISKNTGPQLPEVGPFAGLMAKNTGPELHEVRPFAPREVAYRPGRFYAHYGR